MPAVPIPRTRQHLGVQNPPAAVGVPPSNPPLGSQENQTVAVRSRPPQVLVPASPEMMSDPPASDDRSTRIYTVRGADIVLNRYRVRGSIGFGSSGTVVRAEDRVTGTAVAIKVLHRDPGVHVDSRNEEATYEKLLAGCSPHIGLFAQVLGGGIHRGHRCIVFELCQTTLYDVLQEYSGLTPLPMLHVIEIAFQVLKAVEYLHSLNIVHTDIKLENIALKSMDTVKIRWLDPMAGFDDKKILVSSQLCLIDLGGAVELQGCGVCHGRIGTRGYRAPEVALGLPWGREVDIFSVGCVVAEAYLAHSLFDPHIEGDREYLAAVDRLVGPYSRQYAEGIESKFPGTFDLLGERAMIRYPAPGSLLSTSDHVESLRRLERVRPLAARVHEAALHDLLRKLMAPVPADCISSEIAAKHPFFDNLSRLQWS